MIRYKELKPILDRIAAGEGDDADIAPLRRAIREGLAEGAATGRHKQNIHVGGGVTNSNLIAAVHVGKYVVDVAGDDDIKIGNRIYRGESSHAIREMLGQMLAELDAQPAEAENSAAGDGQAADTAALKVHLYDALGRGAFTLEDLEDLCFRLGVDWDSLRGDTRPSKARALVAHFARRHALPTLAQAIMDARPDLAATLHP